MSLDRLVAAARSASPDWDAERAARVLASTAARHDRRLARARATRRALIGASAAASFVLAVLRGGAAPSSAAAHGIDDGAPAPETALVLHGAADDGGYARD